MAAGEAVVRTAADWVIDESSSRTSIGPLPLQTPLRELGDLGWAGCIGGRRVLPAWNSACCDNAIRFMIGARSETDPRFDAY